MKKTGILSLMLAVLLACSLLVGCSPRTVEDPDPSFTVTDSRGRVISFASSPVRVVSLAPTVTEILYALGAGSFLSGRTDWCNYPAEVSDVPSVGNMDVPDLEALIALQPQVVFLSEMTRKEVADLIENAGIPYFVVKNEDSFDGAYQSIRMVADVMNKRTMAETIIAEMQAKVAHVLETVKDAPRPRVYYVMGFGEWGDFTAGKGTFISEMIAMAGGDNVANDTEGWSYSLEKILQHDPEVLLTSDSSPPDQLREAVGYRTLTAVKNNRIHPLADDTLHRLGPRLADGLKAMAKAIHPGLF